MNPAVDWFFEKPTQWQQAYKALRSLLLECKLVEELKWGCPCYTHNDANVVLIHGFKSYCALLFMKGALLKDPAGILVQQTENVQSARQIRFTDVEQIIKLKATVQDYVREAVTLEASGQKVTRKTTSEFPVCEEFQRRLDASAKLKKAFQALTPGRQRAYLMYFAQAKMTKTREARVEKSVPDILAGKGLDD